MNIRETGTQGTPRNRTMGRAIAFVVAAMALLCIGFVAGGGLMWWIGPEIRAALAPVSLGDQPRTEQLGLLNEAWDILDREYISPDEMDAAEMVYGAAAGMVAAVGDAHTSFVKPEPAAIMEEDMTGSFEGIGATVNMNEEGQVVIVEPMPGSPALDAGIKPDDIILAVDDQSLEGMDLMEAIGLIRGERGTVARLLVLREGVAEPFVVPVTRDRIELVTVTYEMLDNQIAYVSLAEFNAVSADKVREALDELMADDPVGLIFDLRGDPGGYLHMAVEVASEFLPRGEVVLIEQERYATKDYTVTRRGHALDIPMVLLVDGGSASASEIVAGALRDHGRATLIGERTYGKGFVQSTHTLSDGSSLRVTIAKWLLPSGAHLDGEGIEPDVVVERTLEDYENDLDPQLDRAVDYLLDKEHVSNAEQEEISN